MDYSSFSLQEGSTSNSVDMFKQQQGVNGHESMEFINFMNQSYNTHNNNNSNNNNNNSMTNNINHHSNNNNNGLFSVPQLTPDGHQDNSFTGSSVLSGHNPEYNMSPLQINNHAANYTPIQHPLHNQTIDDFGDEEEFLTPLVSPAMAPTYNNNYHFNTSTDNIFSPLTSPALHPSSSSVMDQHLLQQKLALIERQQQQLRSMQHQLNTSSTDSPTTSPLVTYSTESRKKSLQPKITAVHSPQTKLGLVKKIPESSPLALGPSNNSSMMAPATPSLLMKLGAGNNSNNSTPPTSTSSPLPSTAVDNMPVLPAAILQDDNTATNKTKAVSNKRRRISQTKFSYSPGLPPSAESPAGLRPLTSPRTLKPLISPSLKPNGQRLSTIDEEVARTLLATKSNYENLKEGNVKSLGLDFSTTIQSGIEHRRSAHKAAEQKRRDILKQSFDSLRTEITEAMIEEELAEDQHMDQAELRNNKERDVKQMSKIVLLQHSYEYIVRLKSDNKRKDEKMKNMKEEIMSLRKQLGLPEITKEEQEQEEKERQEEKEKRQERLKRLQQQTASITHNNNAIINNDKK